MTATGDAEYPDELITFLETLWGAGYLSPGGPAEVDRVLAGMSLAGCDVLDLGCGSGGISLHLAERHGARSVTGIDVEGPVLAKARERVDASGLADRVRFAQVAPGPLPFPDRTFDIVFSKDAIVHIPDKHAIMAEIHRVLKPGGRFAASDWLISHDGEPTPPMADYIRSEGLSFGMASPTRYREAMVAAGFAEVELVNRNPWYREVARGEFEQLSGALYERAVAAAGRALVDHNIGTWKRMLTVLESGEHCPHHLRARRPLGG
ncbi:MAG: methyltransferase domain-containing protein [Rhizobiales bacterium]|nr:methyltransferase domain-containing protein [Hyphomicrobiales bacterium]